MPTAAPLSSSGPGPANPQQHGIDYYRSTAEDDAAVLEDRRMRSYEEKQRKKEQKKFVKAHGPWDPLRAYKPDKPSNLGAYKASGSYRRKKEGFTAFLRGAAAQHKSRDGSEETNGSQPASSSSSTPATFAANPSFAPPAFDEDTSAALSSDLSGGDAYARRMRLSQQQSNVAPPPPPSVADDYVPPPPPPPPAASTPALSSYQGATISAPPVRYESATISAPPVRYERPDVQMEDADNEPAHDERPAKRAKISKAELMMNKMGYKKGQGLGKNNDGVVTHLEVKMRKAPQGPSILDDENGKVKSQQVWDVRGGMRIQKDEPGKFGEKSSVVVTWGCVDGVDWDANAERNDGGIRQDMGEAFGKKVNLSTSSLGCIC
jgi:splicing factor 45